MQNQLIDNIFKGTGEPLKPIIPFTQTPLQDFVFYNPIQGTFYNIVAKRPYKKKFRIPIREIGLQDKTYHYTEIAFMIMTGDLPFGKCSKGTWQNITYLDGDPTNFKWDNLKDESAPPVAPGVYWSDRFERYRVTVRLNNKYKSLLPKTLEKAIWLTQQDTYVEPDNS